MDSDSIDALLTHLCKLGHLSTLCRVSIGSLILHEEDFIFDSDGQLIVTGDEVCVGDECDGERPVLLYDQSAKETCAVSEAVSPVTSDPTPGEPPIVHTGGDVCVAAVHNGNIVACKF